MKVVNNALFISSMVTTSEALAYGEHGGLDLETMLGVVNESSGQNFLTTQVLPKYLTGGDWGAEAQIIQKDLSLFVEGTKAEDAPNAAITRAYDVITAFAEADPMQDVGRFHDFLRNKKN